MTSHFQNGSVNGHRAANKHTLTALNRWSIINKQLPPVSDINAIHVYDFDNTLFQTPLPNQKIWNGQSLGQLASPDVFINGGWWHDSRILAATGNGVEQEEPRAWKGWWNEKIVELVQLSMQQKDALCVLLTGRSEKGFSDLILRIVKSRGLDFDMIGLKPPVGPSNEKIQNTMHYKQLFIGAMLETYKSASEIRIYEDRPKHVTGFRNFLTDYNQRIQQLGDQATRGSFAAEVIPVADFSTTLDPVVEVAEIQHLVNSHNQLVKKRGGRRMTLKKTVFFTGYMLDSSDTKRLLDMTNVPSNVADVKYHANQILICPRECPPQILAKVGGMNARMRWQVVATGCFENSVWAAAVKPVPENAPFHTENATPFVLLALRKGARPADAAKIQHWLPVPSDKAYQLDTTVGEKVMLCLEAERGGGGGDGGDGRGGSKRKFAGDDDFRSSRNNGNNNNNSRGGARGGGQNFQGRGGGNFRGGAHNTPGNRGHHRGGGARGGAGRGGGGGGGGGRGGKNHGYRSLDDVGGSGNQGGFGYNGGAGVVSYDDSSFPSLPGQQQRQGGGGGAPMYGGQASQGQGASWQSGGPNNGQMGGGGGGGGDAAPDFQSLY